MANTSSTVIKCKAIIAKHKHKCKVQTLDAPVASLSCDTLHVYDESFFFIFCLNSTVSSRM